MGDLTELNEKVYSDIEVQNPDQQLEEQVGEESTFVFSSNQIACHRKAAQKMQRDVIPGRRK